MKRLLCCVLLCALLLCGCGEKKIHVYADCDRVVEGGLAAGASPVSVWTRSALLDSSIPEDAILHIGTRNRRPSPIYDPVSFWNEMGFPCKLSQEDMTYCPLLYKSFYHITATKGQWLALMQSEDFGYLFGKWIVSMYVRSPEPWPEDYGTGALYFKASPGVILYAEHPERFVNPPTVSYSLDDRTYYAAPQNIPALLEREDVLWMRFTAPYMIKE